MQADLEAIIERFGADTGTIHLVQDGMLVLKAHVGIPPPVLRIIGSIPIGKGMAGQAVQANAPVSSCDLQSDQTGDVQPGAKPTGVAGAVVVPIRDDRGSAVGALGIGVHRMHEYSAADIAALIEAASTL